MEMKEDYHKSLVEFLVKNERIHRNSKYGQFIIQTNEVQFYLLTLILLRCLFPGKEIRKYLEGSTLGNLINCFRIIILPNELSLLKSLEKYNNYRNALAHKMYTDKKLSEEKCISSIELGDKILAELKRLINLN